MTTYAQINDEIAERIDDHAKRLSTIFNVVNLWLYCLESDICCDSQAELFYLGYIIKEYITNTRVGFERLEQELGTLP